MHGPVHVGVFPARLGTTQLNKLRKTHIDALVVKLSKQGLSGSTVRQVYTVLRAALDDAVLDGLMARNPCTLVKRPGVERREARHLDAETVAAVLKVAEDFAGSSGPTVCAARASQLTESTAVKMSGTSLRVV